MTHDDIKVGSKLRNNDPRKNGDTITVEALIRSDSGAGNGDNFAVYRSAKRTARIRFDHIFTDGKTRAVGYNLLP